MGKLKASSPPTRPPLNSNSHAPSASSSSYPVPGTIEETHVENGREYHGYRKGIYMMPCDELEQDRLDMCHQLFLHARKGKNHKAPICFHPSNPDVRILDLGTGTGIWAMDMAE
jgi:hypothetical protein